MAAAGVFAVPTLVAKTRRRLRWRRAGADPVSAAEAAWSDLRDTVRDAGLEWDSAATPRATGRQVADAAHLDADSRDLLTHLVTTTERARYSTRPADSTGLRGDSAMLRRTIMRSRSAAQRFGAAIWPAATRDLVVSSATGSPTAWTGQTRWVSVCVSGRDGWFPAVADRASVTGRGLAHDGAASVPPCAP